MTGYPPISKWREIKVILNDQKFVAKVFHIDKIMDIALVKVKMTLCKALDLGESSDLFLGETVYALGYPLELPVSVTNN